MKRNAVEWRTAEMCRTMERSGEKWRREEKNKEYRRVVKRRNIRERLSREIYIFNIRNPQFIDSKALAISKHVFNINLVY